MRLVTLIAGNSTCIKSVCVSTQFLKGEGGHKITRFSQMDGTVAVAPCQMKATLHCLEGLQLFRKAGREC